MTQAKNRATPMDRDVSDKVRAGKDIVREETVHAEVPFTYKPMALLDVDTDIKSYYSDKGYALRWMRWQKDGQVDFARLQQVEHQTWTPVQADELPKDKAFRMQIQSVPGFGDIFVKGDLALFKIDKRHQAEIKKYYDNLAESQVINTNQRLKEVGADSVLNESSSQVSIGKRPTEFE